MRRLVRASLNSSIRSPRDLAKQSPATPEPAASPSTSEHTTAWVTQTAGQALESPIHWLVLVPYRFHGHGFNFDPIIREFREEETRVIIRRFMKRGLAPNEDVHAPEILIASRVVSRSHAEIWCESGGDFYIRDVSSSSGTYLNRERLSEPGQHSPAFPLRDSDVIQLGVDYEDGVQVMDRAVKIRVVIGHGKRRLGPSRLDVAVDGRAPGYQQQTDILDPISCALVDPTPSSPSSTTHDERSQQHLSGVSLLTHTGRIDTGMTLKARPSLARPLAIEDASSSSRPLSRSSLPYLAMSLDPETAPPRYHTPSPTPPDAPVGATNSPLSKSSPIDPEPPSCADSEGPDLTNETEIARYASENRNMISPDLEAKLIKAHYMPEDDPDEISAQEWQSEYGVGYFELKRLRQLYARYSGQGRTKV